MTGSYKGEDDRYLALCLLKVDTGKILFFVKTGLKDSLFQVVKFQTAFRGWYLLKIFITVTDIIVLCLFYPSGSYLPNSKMALTSFRC